VWEVYEEFDLLSVFLLGGLDDEWEEVAFFFLGGEREEREEDRGAVMSLLDGLGKKASSEAADSAGSERSLETVKVAEPESHESCEGEDDGQEASESPPTPDSAIDPSTITTSDLNILITTVSDRLTRATPNRRSSLLQSKSQLREELSRSKEQLIIETSRSQDFSRRLSEQDQELSSLRDQLRESHSHFRTAQTDKQRLEKQLQELKSAKPAATPEGTRDGDGEWPTPKSTRASASGLRELKLGRSPAPSFGKRTSSLNAAALIDPALIMATETKPEVDSEALVLELVQAKTAEAVAKQEAEEAKAKLESLRKMLGIGSASGESPGHRSSPSQPVLGNLSLSGFGTKGREKVESAVALVTPSTSTGGSGGFWGAWGKRSVSGAVPVAAGER